MDTSSVARRPERAKALHLHDPAQASAPSCGNTQDAQDNNAPPVADLYEHHNRREPVVELAIASRADAANS
ncbi:hypothetical protein ACYX78_11100 [Advenella incenata]